MGGLGGRVTCHTWKHRRQFIRLVYELLPAHVTLTIAWQAGLGHLCSLVGNTMGRSGSLATG